MSDDFQRGLQARLAHLISEASQWSRGSGAHPPGLVKALNEAFEYGCAEIERLRARIAELEKYKLDCNAYAATVRALERAVEEICRERATPPITRARLRHALAGVDWRKAR